MADTIAAYNVKISAETGNVTKGYKEIKTGAKKMAGQVDTQTKNMDRSFKNTFSKIRSGWLLVAGVITGIVGKAISKVISLASDFEETTGKFNVVFRGVTEQANIMATELQMSFGLSLLEAKKLLSGVQDFLVPMGFARDSAANLSGEMVRLAADFASFNNLNTADVVNDFQGALTGISVPMKKYGVDISEIGLKQFALSKGISQSVKDMSRQEKAALVMQKIMADGADAVGDFARTQDSFANKTRILSAMMSDLGRKIGQSLLKAFERLTAKITDIDKIRIAFDNIATAIDKLIIGFTILVRVSNIFWNTLTIPIHAIVGSLTALALGLEAMFTDPLNAVKAFKEIGAVAFKPLMTDVSDMKNNFAGIVSDIKEMTGELNTAYDAVDKIKTSEEDTTEELEKQAEELEKQAGWRDKAARDAAADAAAAATARKGKLQAGAISVISAFDTASGEAAAQGLSNSLKRILSSSGFWGSIAASLIGFFEKVGAAGMGKFIKEFISKSGEIVGNIVGGAVVGAVETILNIPKLLKTIFQGWAKGIVQGAVEIVKKGFKFAADREKAKAAGMTVWKWRRAQLEEEKKLNEEILEIEKERKEINESVDAAVAEFNHEVRMGNKTVEEQIEFFKKLLDHADELGYTQEQKWTLEEQINGLYIQQNELLKENTDELEKQKQLEKEKNELLEAQAALRTEMAEKNEAISDKEKEINHFTKLGKLTLQEQINQYKELLNTANDFGLEKEKIWSLKETIHALIQKQNQELENSNKLIDDRVKKLLAEIMDQDERLKLIKRAGFFTGTELEYHQDILDLLENEKREIMEVAKNENIIVDDLKEYWDVAIEIADVNEEIKKIQEDQLDIGGEQVDLIQDQIDKDKELAEQQLDRITSVTKKILDKLGLPKFQLDFLKKQADIASFGLLKNLNMAGPEGFSLDQIEALADKAGDIFSGIGVPRGAEDIRSLFSGLTTGETKTTIGIENLIGTLQTSGDLSIATVRPIMERVLDLVLEAKGIQQT